jgi:alkylation response protein AidB-like acyl-CoA dehydrogenase
MLRDIDITFSEEQGVLLDMATAFADAKSTRHQVRSLSESPSGFDLEAWREMAALGWAGLVTPEAYGGADLSIAGAVPILEALGRRLMSTPLLGGLLASYALALGDASAVKSRWLPRLGEGAIGAVGFAEPGRPFDWSAPICEAIPTPAGFRLRGTKSFVAFAADAQVIIVNVRVGSETWFAAVPREAIPSANLTPVICTDVTQRVFTVDLTGVEIARDDVWQADVTRISRAATLLIAAEMCGATSGAMEVTLDYLRTRRQFGKPIGAYQALKHTMADIYVQHELLRSLVYAAASNFDSDTGDMLTRMAKAKADTLFVHTSDRAVQFHGGFGFTYDCDAGFYLRRAVWSQAQFGDARHHRKRLAGMLFDAQ